MKFRLETQSDWSEFSTYLSECKESSVYEVEIVEKRVRTGQQRKAIELFCKMLAERLNETGMDMVRALKVLRKSPEISIPWTQELVKDNLWRPVQRALFDIESTAKLETMQVRQVENVLNKNLADKLGVSVEFPDNRGR